MTTTLITTVVIPKTSGKKTIADSKGVFYWIDPDFKSWQANEPGTSQKETTVEVREMTKSTTFKEMVSTDALLTQDQILWFVENHKDLLCKDWYTYFPFKSGNKVFVADVRFDGLGRLEVRVDRFSEVSVWLAVYRPRLVVPQLKTSDTLTATDRPSDAASLSLAGCLMLITALETRISVLEADMVSIRKFLII